MSKLPLQASSKVRKPNTSRNMAFGILFSGSGVLLWAAFALNWDVIIPEGALLLGSRETRLWALEELEKLESDGVPGLVMGLSDEHPQVRFFAAFRLRNLELKALKATPALLKVLDKDSDVRSSCSLALSKFGDRIDQKYRAELVTKLATFALEDEHHLGDNGVSSALAKLSKSTKWPELKLAVPILTKALTSDQPHIRESAFRTLYFADPVIFPSKKLMTGGLHDPNPVIRRIAIYMLARYKMPREEFLPILRTALSDIDPRVKLASVIIMGELGPDSRKFIPEIIDSILLFEDAQDDLAKSLVLIDFEFAMFHLKGLSKLKSKRGEAAKELFGCVRRCHWAMKMMGELK